MTRQVTPTYTLLNQIMLAAQSNSVTFGNIPQNYTDLVLITNNFGTASNGDSIIRFNNDSSNIYGRAFFYGLGGGSSGGSFDTRTYASGYFPRTTPGISITNIFDYSSIDKHKTILSSCDSPDYATFRSIIRWPNTSAITSIFLSPLSGNFAVGSMFSLYGVR